MLDKIRRKYDFIFKKKTFIILIYNINIQWRRLWMTSEGKRYSTFFKNNSNLKKKNYKL